MSRYGFAIKALPKGGKPFGDEDDDQNDTSDPAGGELEAPETAMPGSEPGPAEPGPDSNADPAEPAVAADPAPDAPGGPAAESGELPPEGGDQPATDAPEAPTDDSRPWSGDMYDEGDETDPADALYGYTGTDGEQAWLDKAPDGTLTGWVRDSTGQVWRYTNPDSWALDVDGAQMTRTHSQAEGDTAPDAPGGPAQPADRGAQDSMFANQ